MSADAGSSPGRTTHGSLTLTFSRGLLLGLGFGIGLVVVVMTADVIRQRFQSSKPAAPTVWHKRFTPEAKLTVEHDEARRTQWNVIILGSVRNSGRDSWQYVRLQVRLLDDTGKLVHLCTGSVNGPVRPGATRDFSVDCGGVQNEPVPPYKKYEVEVVNAGYEMENGA